jgi:hypoxanthine phosphoribosyltransferase
VPDEFVVGYGLDYAERYRNLPYVGVLKPEIYAD